MVREINSEENNLVQICYNSVKWLLLLTLNNVPKNWIYSLIWLAIDDQYESHVKRVGRMYDKLGIEFKGYVAIIWISSQSLGFRFY